jgi:hypothetical protein
MRKLPGKDPLEAIGIAQLGVQFDDQIPDPLQLLRLGAQEGLLRTLNVDLQDVHFASNGGDGFFQRHYGQGLLSD